MASAGSSFDFASDDVLCSFDEVVSHDLSNEKKSDELEKDLPESGIGRELVCVYREEEECPKEDIIDVVEKCMKKYTDSLVQHFEGINGRLTQLEIQCYKLERSMGEFRADSSCDQGEVNSKLKAVSKQLHEVHRSIQIIRDKQELAETQKELSKLQVPSKESNSSPSQSQKSDMSSLSSASDPKQPSEIPNPRVALALPHQIVQQQQHYMVNQRPIPFYSQQPEVHYIPEPQQVHHQPFILANSNYTQPKPLNYVQASHHPQIMNNINNNKTQGQEQQPPAVVYIPARPDPPALVVPLLQPQFQVAPSQAILIRPHTPQESQMQGYSTLYRTMDTCSRTYSHPPNYNHSIHSSTVQQVMPYADIIDKASNIGYSREQVVHAVNDLVDRGRFVDFDAILHTLHMTSGAFNR